MATASSTMAMPPWFFEGDGLVVSSVLATSISRLPLFGFFDFMAFEAIESMANTFWTSGRLLPPVPACAGIEGATSPQSLMRESCPWFS